MDSAYAAPGGAGHAGVPRRGRLGGRPRAIDGSRIAGRSLESQEELRRPPQRASSLPLWLMVGAACLLNFAWLFLTRLRRSGTAPNICFSAMNYRALLARLVDGNVARQGGWRSSSRASFRWTKGLPAPLFHSRRNLIARPGLLRSLVMAANSLVLAILAFSALPDRPAAPLADWRAC